MGKKCCKKKPRCKDCPKRKDKIERGFCPDLTVDRKNRAIFPIGAG